MRIFGHHPWGPDQPKPPKKRALGCTTNTGLHWVVGKFKIEMQTPKWKKTRMFLFDFCFGIWVLQITAWFSENGHHFKKRFILENLRFSNVTNSRASRDTFRIVIPYTYLHGWGELSCMAPSTHPETNIALKVRWFEDYFSVGIPF